MVADLLLTAGLSVGLLRFGNERSCKAAVAVLCMVIHNSTVTNKYLHSTERNMLVARTS